MVLVKKEDKPRKARKSQDYHKNPSPAQRFGHIPGIQVGAKWKKRLECSDAHIHPGIIAGIYGSASLGAYSIVLNGGYDDDLDKGETVIYTGAGGREKSRGGKQVKDQSFENRFNAALKISYSTKNPVRVLRGYKLPSPYAPAEGYRYDGLYTVIRAYEEKGREGFNMCRFELQRMRSQDPLPFNDQFYKRPAHLKRRKRTSTTSSDDTQSSAPSTPAPETPNSIVTPGRSVRKRKTITPKAPSVVKAESEFDDMEPMRRSRNDNAQASRSRLSLSGKKRKTFDEMYVDVKPLQRDLQRALERSASPESATE